MVLLPWVVVGNRMRELMLSGVVPMPSLSPHLRLGADRWSGPSSNSATVAGKALSSQCLKLRILASKAEPGRV